MSMFVCILGLLLPVGLIVVALRLARWVLRPLDEASRRRKGRLQFTLGDLVCLFFMLQLCIGGLWTAYGGPRFGGRENVNGLVVVGCVVAGLFWWLSVQMLSRAGVWNTWWRSLLLVVVVPATIAGSVVAPVAVAMLLMIMPFGEEPGFNTAVMLCVVLGTLALLWGCAWATRRAVGRLPAEGGPASGASAGQGKDDEDDEE